MQSDGRLISSGEVAKRLGLHLRKVQRMAKAGQLPVAQEVAGRLLFDAAAIEFIARQREQAEARSA